MTPAEQANEYDHPVIAATYDGAEGSREDLDHYVALLEELGARRVVDVGCGTGVLATMLAERGCAVTGVEPAGAMLTSPGPGPAPSRSPGCTGAPRTCRDASTGSAPP